jgi:hypothetical protein
VDDIITKIHSTDIASSMLIPLLFDLFIIDGDVHFLTSIVCDSSMRIALVILFVSSVQGHGDHGKPLAFLMKTLGP